MHDMRGSSTFLTNFLLHGISARRATIADLQIAFYKLILHPHTAVYYNEGSA